MQTDEKYLRILHKLDYFNYQQGLIVRRLNQGQGWDQHLENCRRFILKSLDSFKPETVTVLGSGWLLDLPLAELAERCRRINLVDIVHPPEVIEQTANISSVKLYKQDVTGGIIEELWHKKSSLPFFRKLKSLDGINIPEYVPGFDPGVVISLNLLSQLDVLPVRYLQKNAAVSDAEILRFRKEIQARHLSFLMRHNSVLISDVEEKLTSAKGETNVQKTVVTDLPSGIHEEEWEWDFDLKSYDYNNLTSVLRVKAIVLQNGKT